MGWGTFSMVCRSVAGSSMMCRKSSVTRGVKPLKPELCVKPRIMRVLLSSANIMAYWWARVRRRHSRSVACRVSGSTGTLIMLTQARISTVVISSVRPCTTMAPDSGDAEESWTAAEEGVEDESFCSVSSLGWAISTAVDADSKRLHRNLSSTTHTI